MVVLPPNESFRRELVLRKYAISTVDTYTSCLNLIISKIGDHPTLDQIKDFLITIKNYSYHKQMVATIHRYFEFVLKKPLRLDDIPFPRRVEKLQEILSIEEMQRLIEYPKNKKHQAIIFLLYGCGLRVGEVLNLKMADIDQERMVLTVKEGKGNKDRQVGIDEGILSIILDYYNQALPDEYLFKGQFGGQYSNESINTFLKYYAKKAGITKRIHAHKLRSCYATHLHEGGVEARTIQKLLGHKNIKTTDDYLKNSRVHLKGSNNPINFFKHV